ncbi:TetR family transcriptional regulator [Advenella kashmirensis WT001]|uniref:TetR family transcriptional regulator n=1 Tax=Advenella kashmirensis (strain DSM 17095 / LMG 22695 / WT001) TaxID=1036672 RepID=I3UHC4_ADVKW|nr:TetR family transcriptional regulator [Advenella kashmirensis WT001]
MAWDKLVEHGYTSLTMEMVASAALTSRSVLARRWTSKAALVMAAIKYQLSRQPPQVSDQGDVRVELLEYLQRLGNFAPIFATVNACCRTTCFARPSLRRKRSGGR